MSVDAYEILGVDEGVDAQQLRSAYRARARLVHPDVNPDPAGQLLFAQLSNAYRILTDPATRSEIDAQRSQRTRFEQERPPAAARTRAGRDVVVRLLWDEAPPRRDALHRLTVTALATCERCAGAGSDRPEELLACAGCAGTGYLRHRQQTLESEVLTWRGCRDCAATGVVAQNPCPDCAGEGRRRTERGVAIRVTADTEPGSTLVVHGAGHVGRLGGPAGDLLVVVAAEPAPPA